MISYSIFLFISALIVLCIAITSLLRSDIAAARPFALLMCAMVIWSGGYAMEILVSGMCEKTFWARLHLLGIGLITVAWYVFATRYTADLDALSATVGTLGTCI